MTDVARAGETNRPFLSVVIPTFNRCESLRVTLDALASQATVPGGVEVLVVSDGSSDGTDAYLREWAARAATVQARPLFQANAGPARARNHGVREARGDVIIFTDDDVEPQPGYLLAHATRHRADEKLVLIGPMSRDPHRRPREPVWIAWEHAMLQKQYDNWQQGVWAEDECGPHNFYTGNASVRRAHVMQVGGFDEGFTRQEDVELAMRMERECGVHFRFDPALAALHRPLRSFDGWLRVPYAYGQLDVVRAQRGDASWNVVRESYRSRHKATRLLADFALPGITRGNLMRSALRRAAEALHAVPTGPTESVAIFALSALYNQRYLEGARDQLGSWPKLRDVMHAERQA
jgi:glycosyltransferase involved in cell wall biosynthesis